MSQPAVEATQESSSQSAQEQEMFTAQQSLEELTRQLGGCATVSPSLNNLLQSSTLIHCLELKQCTITHSTTQSSPVATEPNTALKALELASRDSCFKALNT